jgi:hypothetical protein
MYKVMTLTRLAYKIPRLANSFNVFIRSVDLQELSWQQNKNFLPRPQYNLHNVKIDYIDNKSNA